MHYEYVAIPEEQVPQAANPTLQHVVTTYASETNKTVGVWRAIPDGLLDYWPHEKVNTIRAILAHQILSERRFFARFVGTVEPPVEGLLPPGESPPVLAYIERYLRPAKARLPQLAAATADWWLEERPFFGGLRRQRIWTFWRRVLRTPATTAPRSRHGCDWPVPRWSRRSTGRPVPAGRCRHRSAPGRPGPPGAGSGRGPSRRAGHGACRS
jgi:hypothetical protein